MAHTNRIPFLDLPWEARAQLALVSRDPAGARIVVATDDDRHDALVDLHNCGFLERLPDTPNGYLVLVLTDEGRAVVPRNYLVNTRQRAGHWQKLESDLRAAERALESAAIWALKIEGLAEASAPLILENASTATPLARPEHSGLSDIDLLAATAERLRCYLEECKGSGRREGHY